MGKLGDVSHGRHKEVVAFVNQQFARTEKGGGKVKSEK
jgi:hypothetical protein